MGQLPAQGAGLGGKFAVHTIAVAANASVKSGATATGDGPIDMDGPRADITPQESTAGRRSLAAGWTFEQSGNLHKRNGEFRP